MKKIDFVIIGGQKSGSTFIQEVIAEHPQVYLPKGEITYLEDPDYQQGGLDKLWQLFENQDESKTWGIKRPNLLGCDKCPERIYQGLDNPKLIVILRDPIERAVSAYYHYINNGFLPPYPLEEGMKALLENKLQSKYPRSKEILKFGFYYQHLSNYFRAFAKDQVLVLTYDHLKKNKKEVIRQVYSFLNVEENFIPIQSLNSTPQKVIYSMPRQKFLRLSNKYKWSYNAENTRLENKEQNVFEKGICYLIRQADQVILSKVFDNEKPTISSHLEQQLYEVYKKDINNLEKLLNEDLSSWKKLHTVANVV